MAKKVLLIIDMLNDFIKQDGKLSCGKDAEGTVPLAVKKANEFVNKGFPIILIKDAHTIDDEEFKRFPVHCVKGTQGAEVIEELSFLESYPHLYSIEKQRYSAFFDTGLEEILKNQKPAEVHVVGVCTNICVLYTVEELCNRDYKVIVYKDGVASFDIEAHNFALQQMENVLGARII